jgi:hypothetical protein
MEYNIKRNEAFNSLEITFDGKPSEAVRDALKALRFRWHGVKKLWYGYTDEETARAAIEGADKTEEAAPVYEITTREGYMGAIAWDGSNSRRSDLYGAGLSKAIREALKGDGIKGVTVSVKTYTGGQSITLKITATPRDYLELAEYIDATHIWDFSAFGWIVDTDSETGEQVSTEAVNGWSHEKMRRVHAELARRDMESMKGAHAQLNHFHVDNYKVFRPDFIK